ncbi:LLM class flavin-dependent oxidoreductase [Blastococcus sp. BMG 814]|uniref:LLM class flavin-dependent oxidoreductase n=1 Tax=Blastococcus carthaginiensis TaxID=3050034 RepID=A0ABT9I6L3_9ACTN|nr:LLM class flavin-dependent oxidoreductase [Blastococcus carthaginiensis]MDP5181217.1 LLM class flavin-dependent oxidoreductase [Blastococcus carthaginiensis]
MTAVLLNSAAPWGAGDAVATAEHALAAGADGVGLADSPRLFPDCLVETQRVLAGTGARLAGPCVASLGLRHPAPLAGAVRTLERLHPGRVLTVVGRGESSVRNEGLDLPPLREYTATLAALREAVGDADLAGRLLGAASGPRTISATAAALGGVLVDAGADPGVVTRAAALAREADPAATVWLFLRATVTATDAEAAAAAEPVLGSCAMRLVSATEWYGLDADEVASAREVAGSHDYARHGTAAARGGAVTPADRWVRDRFLLTGDPTAITARLRPLAGLDIAGVVLAGAVAGVQDHLAELVPAVRAGLEEAA